MDLRLMRTFVAAYETGSFSKAAIRLNATQPGVSTQIAQLENELGVTLFERKGRGVASTMAGARLYGHASQILQAVGLAESEIRGLSGSIMGRLAIGIPPTLSGAILGPVLNSFAASHPDVEIRIFEAYSDTLLALVESGELDCAIVARLPDHAAIEYRPIFRDRFVIVSGRQQMLPKNVEIRLDEPPYFKIMMPSLLRHGLQRLLEEPLRTKRIIPQRVIEMDGLTGVLQFLALSNWIALLPAATAHHDNALKLQFNPIAGPDISIDYFVAKTRSVSLSIAAQTFMQLASSELERIGTLP